MDQTKNINELQQLINGSSQSNSTAILHAVMADTIGMSMHNAVNAQHNSQLLSAASTTAACARILGATGVQSAAMSVGPSDSSTQNEDGGVSQASSATSSPSAQSTTVVEPDNPSNKQNTPIAPSESNQADQRVDRSDGEETGGE